VTQESLLKRIGWPVLTAAAGATGAVLVRHAWERKLGPSHGVPHPLLADTLGARLAASSLAFVPMPKTVLGPKDLVLDAALGGRDGDDRWRYWSPLDGSPNGVVASYLIGKAGWPKAMTNRSEDDTWVPGDGFVRGADVAKVRDGAKKRGWLVTPVFPANDDKVPETAGLATGLVVGLAGFACVSSIGSGVAELLDLGIALGESFELEAGDYFAAGAKDPEHPSSVGVVIEVADGNGSRNVVTVEGCTSEGKPCARWRTRTFHNDGRFATHDASGSGEGSGERLLWVVRPT
jgi:hypothetical protein